MESAAISGCNQAGQVDRPVAGIVSLQDTCGIWERKQLGRDCSFAAKPAITETSATLVRNGISPPPMALYSDVTESGNISGRLHLPSRFAPIARLNGAGPVIWVVACYRGHYLHDGSVASLEDIFDPDRLRDSHVPGGDSPPGVQNRAIKGHEFGLKLSNADRTALIAFLKTL